MEYSIAYSDTLKELVNQVTKQIAEGWIPQGGPVFYPVYADNSGKAWIQALIRRKE